MAIFYQNPTYMAIKSLLETLFPNTGWQLSLLGSGTSSVAWSAKAYQYQLIVRAATTNSIRAQHYEQEFAILELLHARGCPVPEPIATSLHDNSRIGTIEFDWIITREIEGKSPISHLLSEQNAYAIGEMLAHLHHMSVQGYGPPIITRSGFIGQGQTPHDGVVSHWQDYQLWGVHENVSLKSTVIGSKFPAYLPQIDTYKSEVTDAINRGEPVICHADLHMQNVLLDEHQRLSAVIDFGNACLLPAAWDFAIAARYFGWRAVEDMLIGYSPDDAERKDILGHAYLLGLAFGVFKLQRQFVRDATVLTRARTLQFITHTLNRLNQR